jgi:hypothetical protein
VKGLAIVGLAVLVVTAAGVSGPGGPVALSVSHAPTPPLPVEQFETSGSYPQVLLGRRDFGAVNRALRRAVLADQRAYTPYAQRERPGVRDQGPGIYKTSVRRGYVSASTVVVSALMPLTRELFPGQPDGDGWLGVTIRVPFGMRVAIDELFTNPRRGISALAAAWKARVRRTPGRPCLRLYPAHYAASIANYRAFALTPRGIAIGSWELAACYRLVATVPYRFIRPYLSGLGARLVAGVRAPKRFVRAKPGRAYTRRSCVTDAPAHGDRLPHGRRLRIRTGRRHRAARHDCGTGRRYAE